MMSDNGITWALRPWHYGLLAASALMLAVVYWEGIDHMSAKWNQEEYSHAFMLPFVALFFAWQRLSEFRHRSTGNSWLGVAMMALGVFMYIAGELGSLYTVIQYGFLVALGGVFLSLVGLRAFVVLLPAYALLFFMIPLPDFLYNRLSQQLQLISSELGVEVIRFFGISVFLEGNVIDLGDYQLQVAEACNGLRYLFPLMALGFIAAVIFRGALWKKVLLFVSTVPITILMNSFRIGVIGVMVQYGGIGMAEGFLHDFEGWVIFMACAAILTGEMALLARIGNPHGSLLDAFAIEGPAPLPKENAVRYRAIPQSFWIAFALLVAAVVVSQLLPNREEQIPERRDFLFFPRELGGWSGETDRLDSAIKGSLALDDYLLATYDNGLGDDVNLYIAYYASQRKGASVHSPKSCLPGGGWQMKERSRYAVEVPGQQQPLWVNRVLIQMGEDRRLVYYWFQQRGRLITNEYLLKWLLFWDALIKNRTDGALVRVTSAVPVGEDAASYDAVLSQFVGSIWPTLPAYIPE
ncbi:MAG: VPLPA-CTERM-specific exosortase XrtD [Gammaproteobacteria bacterium]|nr:VPLPA-CTERM-specific exosortase XrtD [Gammaproteobacteria bacterium]